MLELICAALAGGVMSCVAPLTFSEAAEISEAYEQEEGFSLEITKNISAGKAEIDPIQTFAGSEGRITSIFGLSMKVSF